VGTAFRNNDVFLFLGHIKCNDVSATLMKSHPFLWVMKMGQGYSSFECIAVGEFSRDGGDFPGQADSANLAHLVSRRIISSTLDTHNVGTHSPDKTGPHGPSGQPFSKNRNSPPIIPPFPITSYLNK